MSGDGFPEPPKGSPGGLRTAARSLKSAGRDLGEVATGFTGATGALEADWDGDAAGRYRTAAQGLRAVAKAAGRTFADCAEAVDGYADALESAQREIAKLKVAYDDAKARETAAAGAAQRLAGQLLSADPNDVSGLESRIAAAGGDARNAGGDAGRIAGRAREVLAEFKREENKADGVLSGQRVPRGGGLAGGFAGPGLLPAPGVGDGLAPGFGVPLGGLSPFNGLVRVGDPWNSDIPGFGAYLDSQHSSAEPDNSLLNPVDLLSGGLAGLGRKTIARGAGKLVSGLTEGAGVGGERAAIQRARQEAESWARARGGRGPFKFRQAGRKAEAQTRIAFQNRRADTLESLLDHLGKVNVPLPPGLKEIVPHLMRYGTQYRYLILARLLRLNADLQARGPVARVAARAIRRLVRGIGG